MRGLLSCHCGLLRPATVDVSSFDIKRIQSSVNYRQDFRKVAYKEAVDWSLSHVFRFVANNWKAGLIEPGEFGFKNKVSAERPLFIVSRDVSLFLGEPRGGAGDYQRQNRDEKQSKIIGVAALLLAVGLFGVGCWHALILAQDGRVAYHLMAGWLIIGAGVVVFWFGMSNLRPLLLDGATRAATSSRTQILRSYDGQSSHAAAARGIQAGGGMLGGYIPARATG
jgi:hypothetical protein